MIEKLLLLLVLYECCGAIPQDMTGKMFTLPVKDDTSHIKLHANIQQPNITAMTMCQRFFYTGNSTVRTIFSVASRSEKNDLLLDYEVPVEGGAEFYRLHVRGAHVDVYGLPGNHNEWLSVCWTWDASTGLTVLWVNGKRSAHHILSPGSAVPKEVSIALSLEQYSRFNDWDFEGDIADVHFWDYVIAPCEIKQYMDRNYVSPGNVISWEALDFTTVGQVFTVKSDQLC